MLVPRLRLLAAGEPVTVEALAAAVGLPVDEVTRRLAAVPDTEYDEQGRIRATAIRPVMVWGPRDRVYFPKMISALRRRMFVYIGSPGNIAGLAHARNVADIIARRGS